MLSKVKERGFIYRWCSGLNAIATLVLITSCHVVHSQVSWKEIGLIGWSTTSFKVVMPLPDSTIDLEKVVAGLQPKHKKWQISEEGAVVRMSYSVYENATVGTRPFGRIRYKIYLQKNGSQLLCLFQDFTFTRIKRNPRYGKLEEERGRLFTLSDARQVLSDTQWEILRWKTDGVIKRKVRLLNGFGLGAPGT